MHKDYDNLSSHRIKALDPMIVAVLRDMEMFVRRCRVLTISGIENSCDTKGTTGCKGRLTPLPDLAGSLIRRAGEQV